MGKPKAPTPPDPKETAAAQTGTNVTTALANTLLGNVNQVTPDGSLTYSYNGFDASGTKPSALSGGAVPFDAAATHGPTLQSVPPGNRQTYDDPYNFDAPRNYDSYGRSTGGQFTPVAQPAQPAQPDPVGGVSGLSGGGYQITDPTSGASYTIPQITATTTLSPEQRAIKDQTDAASLGLATIANDATGRLGGILNSDFNYDGISAGGDASNLQSANYQQFGSGPQLQTGIAGAGMGFKRGVAGAGQGLSYGAQGAGQGIQGKIGGTPGQGILDQIDGGGQRVFNVDFSGVPSYATSASGGRITRDYGPEDGFSEDRRRVEEALLSRINPDLDRDFERLRTSTANSGVMPGGTAYDRSMDIFGRQSNDARFGAVLAGGQEQSRMMGLERDRAMFQNAAQAQAYGQSYNNALLRNQAAQAELQKQLVAAGFTNDAVNSQFAENLARGNFQNQAQGQGFGQQATAMQLGNAAQAQGFGQLFSNSQLNNAAQGQGFGQNFSNAQLNNAAREAAFNQRFDAANFGNSAEQQMYTNQFGATAANNQLSDQAFNREQAIFDTQNRQRDREIAERTNLRNQPINEIAALLSGAQVQNPQFVNTQSAQIPTVDFAGITQDNYANQVGAYNQQRANRGNMFGNVLNLGGTIGGAAIANPGAFSWMSDRRVKADIRQVAGDWHEFRYIWDRLGTKRIGVMAQDIQKTNPAAVADAGGYLVVDYSMLEAA